MHKRAPKAKDGPPEAPPPTPICAIGASAGGVTALQNFFKAVGGDLGLAYVVIVHLSPDRPSQLAEILGARTKMPVHQIDSHSKLKPNCVYVIPPDRELVIHDDDVEARPFTEPKGRRAPIDLFFRSVAAARGDGMAVALSGSGSDGAVGVRAVKEAGGVIFVQSPAEAEFGMMPQSAIATGAADFIGPIAQMASQIAEVTQSKRALLDMDGEQAESEVRRIVALLRVRTGHDFSSYKRATVSRRIHRRMQVSRQKSLKAYFDYLEKNLEEAQELFHDLLISVTTFFRDREAYAALLKKVIEPLFEKAGADYPIRFWVVGCATGEEAYSIGMLLLEEAEKRKVNPAFQIFASDIDEAALQIAREGRYPRAIEADVSEERLHHFFTEDGSSYRVRKELRDFVLFANHSVLKDPPFIKLDLISCRNLLIYVKRDQQIQLCNLFHYALNREGCLFLGSAETADSAPSLFHAIDLEARLYQANVIEDRVAPAMPQLTLDYRHKEHPAPQPAFLDSPAGAGQTHAFALENSAQPSVLVDGARRIVHLSATASRFFVPSGGPFSSELPDQVRPELRVDLKLALQRALEADEPTLTLPLPVAFNGKRRMTALHVLPTGPKHGGLSSQALVFFIDAGEEKAPPQGQAEDDVNIEELRRLRRELSVAHDRLSTSRYEYDRATQDLRAANEELQSMNEEYRSTAEELETSKEELQSMNEELQTVNAELKSRIETISSAHNDLVNLMTATEIGTLFLDEKLNIKLFTPAVAKIFNIANTDIGRPITNFTHRLNYNDLESEARKVLKSLIPSETEISSSDGLWYAMRISPYRTVDNKIDGVVVTFTDITSRKQTEDALAGELLAMTRLSQLSSAVLETSDLEAPLLAILDVAIELLKSNSVQVFGCLHDGAIHTRQQQASEKRRGTKSRGAGLRGGSNLSAGYGDSKCAPVTADAHRTDATDDRGLWGGAEVIGQRQECRQPARKDAFREVFELLRRVL